MRGTGRADYETDEPVQVIVRHGAKLQRHIVCETFVGIGVGQTGPTETAAHAVLLGDQEHMLRCFVNLLRTANEEGILSSVIAQAIDDGGPSVGQNIGKGFFRWFRHQDEILKQEQQDDTPNQEEQDG